VALNATTAAWYVNVWKAASETVRVGLTRECVDCSVSRADLLGKPFLAPADAGAATGRRKTLRFATVRDPLEHFLSGIGEARERAEGACASGTAAKKGLCDALRRDGRRPDRPRELLRALLDGTEPQYLAAFQHAALMSGVLGEWGPLDATVRLEAFDADWADLRTLAPQLPNATALHSRLHAASGDPHGERKLMLEFLSLHWGYRDALCQLLRPDIECFGRLPALCAMENGPPPPPPPLAPASCQRLPSVPPAVRPHVCNRCHFFARRPYDVDAVAFTHVPKAGGTSMQKFLAGRAQQVGKTHFNARTFSMKNKGTTLDALRMEALKADVILGHAPHAWQADRRALGWRGGDFTAVALLRHPLAQIQSLSVRKGRRN
jgi:hypothetical protein